MFHDSNMVQGVIQSPSTNLTESQQSSIESLGISQVPVIFAILPSPLTALRFVVWVLCASALRCYPLLESDIIVSSSLPDMCGKVLAAVELIPFTFITE
jgi:hypothetical protein